MLSDAEAELEREISDLRSALVREGRAREQRTEVAQLAADTSACVSRSDVAAVVAEGATRIFSSGWSIVSYLAADSIVRFVHGPGAPQHILDDWSDAPIDTDVPICEVMRGEATRFELFDPSRFDAWPLLDSIAERSGIGALVVGRIGRGECPDATVAIVWPDPHEFDNLERELFDLLLTSMAPGFVRSMRTETDGEFAKAVQTWLLDIELPDVDGVEIATLYEPGRDVLAVGGDWFDVIDIDGGRTAILIGDVVGHDVRAAVEMTQVRHVLAAHLVDSGDPVDAFALTDAYLCRRAPNIMATVLVMVIEPGGRMILTSAGHPPPIVLPARGAGGVLASGVGPPLGSGMGGYTSEESKVEPGDVVVAYTDGVVETRGVRIDESVDALLRELETLVASLRDVGDADVPAAIVASLSERVSSPGRNDDAAAVVFRRSC